MTKDGKIKGKFNIIDALVIVLVIATATGIFARYGSRITSAVKSDEEFIYEIRVQSVRQYTVDALMKTMETKSRMSDKKASVDLGEIIDIRVEDATIISEKADGTMVYAPQEDRYNAYVTIKTRGKESDNSYITADSEELSVGRNTEIFSKYVHTSGEILKVERTNR